MRKMDYAGFKNGKKAVAKNPYAGEADQYESNMDWAIRNYRPDATDEEKQEYRTGFMEGVAKGLEEMKARGKGA